MFFGPVGSVEMTTQVPCTLGCNYCPQENISELYDGTPRMKFSAFKEIVEKLPEKISIHFSGLSEPWLNPSCTEMVLYAHRNAFDIQVFTTLMGMKTSDISKIKDIPFSNFVVHIPSKGQKDFNGGANYLKKIKQIIKNDINGLSFLSYGEIPSRLKHILSNEVKPQAVTKNAVYNTRAGNLDSGVPEYIDAPEIYCVEGRLNRNIILPDGTVLLCCMDWSLEHILGNLLEEDYISLFKGEEYKKVLQGMADNNVNILCRNCEKAAKMGESSWKEKILGWIRETRCLKDMRKYYP